MTIRMTAFLAPLALVAAVPAHAVTVVPDNGAADFTLPAPAFSNMPAAIEPTAAVPEPATWAMLIAGFGAVGLVARRRRKKDAINA